MASLKYYLQKKTGESQIYIRFSVSRNILLRRKTGLFINVNDWSDKKNYPKDNDQANKLLKSTLEELSLFLNRKYNEDSAKGEIINNDWLTLSINKCFNRVEKTDLEIFTNYIQRIIDNAPTRKNKTGGIGLTKSTIKNYKIFKNVIFNYEKKIKRVLLFSDINKQFSEDFKTWLLVDKSYSKNYAGRQMEFVKTVCLDAEKNEDIKITKYSTKLDTFRLSDKERYIHTLSFNDLDKIFNTDMPTPHLKEVKKWILLGCYIGQRGGDLLRLTTNDIRLKDNTVYIDLIQQKTDKLVTIPVLKDYVIDILLNDFPKKVSLIKINPYIQKVCELAEINEVVKGYHKNSKTGHLELISLPKFNFITSHSLRRSFATNFYKKIPTPILIGISGHSEERMFLKYINQKADKDANADMFAMYSVQMMKKEEPMLRVLKSNKG